MSVLALDIGAKRIGVAVNPYSDIVIELETINYKNSQELANEVDILISEYTIDTIVLGTVRPDSSLTETIENLVDRFPNIKFHFVDEALSTKEAERQLKEEGIKAGDTDQRAAKIILTQYLAETHE